MGATLDTSAYLTVNVTGATDAAFNGAYVWSATAAKWLKSTTHSLWKNGTTWTLTDGVTTYTAANNGLNIPPTAFTLAPSSTATVNPATTSARFCSTALSGTWAAINSGSGTPVYSEYTMSEAWDTAEKTVFDSLCAFLGNDDDKDAFRGYIPINDEGKPKFANVWKITSGGDAGAFDASRTYGENGNWCNLMINAELEGIFENRSTAMYFAGSVMTWLAETNNMSQTGNVNWCHLRDLPGAPVEQIILSRRYWTIKIPLEILFLTEAVY
jgi:hypothetical protein